jgi:hypothetical protein
MLSHVALVRTEISAECIAPIIMMTRIGELGKLAVTSNQSMLRRNTITLMMEAIHSPETSVLTRATQNNIPEAGFHRSHYCENFESYIQTRNTTQSKLLSMPLNHNSAHFNSFTSDTTTPYIILGSDLSLLNFSIYLVLVSF